MSKTELKPCPFCGGEATVYQDYTGYFVVQCRECGITTLKSTSRDMVEDVWNTRNPTVYEVNDGKEE